MHLSSRTVFITALVLLVVGLFFFYRNRDRFEVLQNMSDELSSMADGINSIAASSGKAMDSLTDAIDVVKDKVLPQDPPDISERLLELKARLDALVEGTSFEGIEDVKEMSRVVGEMADELQKGKEGEKYPSKEGYFYHYSFGRNPVDADKYYKTRKILYPKHTATDVCGYHRRFYVPYAYYKPMHHADHSIFVYNRPFTS